MVGDEFIPLKRSQKICDAQLVIGERYILEVGMPQSASKRGCFAQRSGRYFLEPAGRDGRRFLNMDHFRYWLDDQVRLRRRNDGGLPDEGRSRAPDDSHAAPAPYSVVEQKDNVLTIWTARSTKAGAMDGREFSALVDAVLAKAADMIGVDRKALDDMNRTRRERPDKQIAESNATGSSGDGRGSC